MPRPRNHGGPRPSRTANVLPPRVQGPPEQRRVALLSFEWPVNEQSPPPNRASFAQVRLFLQLLYGARGGSRTRTPLRALAPEASESTNSTTRAFAVPHDNTYVTMNGRLCQEFFCQTGEINFAVDDAPRTYCGNAGRGAPHTSHAQCCPGRAGGVTPYCA